MDNNLDHLDPGSRLAYETARARLHLVQLDRCGSPVHVEDRAKALAAVERAEAAERAYWDAKE